jgi:hypothetical protein
MFSLNSKVIYNKATDVTSFISKMDYVPTVERNAFFRPLFRSLH